MQPFTGSGPGARTPDGCSVELYRRIPYLAELEDVLPLFVPRGRVLELGCGAGRLCRRLLDAGFEVTGVDNSPAMLEALPPQVTAVASNIETLNLPRLFDGVVLAGCLVNHAVEPTRRAFLATARRHVKPGGLLVIQRHDPAWLRTVREGATSEVAGVSLVVDRVVRTQGRIAMTLRYAIDDQVWLHHFEAVALDEADIEALLRDASFTRVRWHGADRLWATAIPV